MNSTSIVNASLNIDEPLNLAEMLNETTELIKAYEERFRHSSEWEVSQNAYKSLCQKFGVEFTERSSKS